MRRDNTSSAVNDWAKRVGRCVGVFCSFLTLDAGIYEKCLVTFFHSIAQIWTSLAENNYHVFSTIPFFGNLRSVLSEILIYVGSKKNNREVICIVLLCFWRFVVNYLCDISFYGTKPCAFLPFDLYLFLNKSFRRFDGCFIAKSEFAWLITEISLVGEIFLRFFLKKYGRLFKYRMLLIPPSGFEVMFSAPYRAGVFFKIGRLFFGRFLLLGSIFVTISGSSVEVRYFAICAIGWVWGGFGGERDYSCKD